MFWGFERKVRKLIAAGKNDEAAVLLRRKVRSNVKPNLRHLNLLGVCESRLGRIGSARDLFRQVLELSPRCSQALNNLGNIAFMSNDGERAREYYISSLEGKPWAIEPRYNLTILYQEMGHFEKAVSAYEEYVTIFKALRWSQLLWAGVLIFFLIVLLQR